jgi:hypothetical protein
MLIILPKDVSINTIDAALQTANKEFAENLRFKRFESAGRTRDGRQKANVTLTVCDSKAPGSRRNYNGGRIAAACWHAHGTFMDALPANTEIRSTAGVTYPGTRWLDWNAGSQVQFAYISELCECGS